MPLTSINYVRRVFAITYNSNFNYILHIAVNYLAQKKIENQWLMRSFLSCEYSGCTVCLWGKCRGGW